jgi:peptidase C39-like protein
MPGRPAALFVVAVGGLVLVSGAASRAAFGDGDHADTAAMTEAHSSAVVPAVAAVPHAAVDPAAVTDVGPEPKAAPASASLEMKHVWQSLNNCGPASVVMALSSFGVDVSQEDARIPLRGTSILSGMGPQRVDGWVSQSFGLRAVWRNNGTNDLLRRLVANGFAPLVTQWMQDPSISRIAHWRVVRGYDDVLATFYVNDPMLGRMVPLSYQWFQDEWQPFSYRYLVIYDPKDERLLRRVIGDDWTDLNMRANFYARTKAEALAQNTQNAWLAYGEAAYGYGAFAEAVAAFEQGMALGSVQGVFTMRSSYPQALRALGRQQDATAAAQRLATSTSATVAAPPDSFALYLAFSRTLSVEAPHLIQ